VFVTSTFHSYASLYYNILIVSPPATILWGGPPGPRPTPWSASSAEARTPVYQHIFIHFANKMNFGVYFGISLVSG